MTKLNNRDYLLCIWRDLNTRRRFVIGKLSRNGMYEFEYEGEEFKQAKKHGFELLTSFPEEKKKYSNNALFAVFKSRLPDRKRKNIKEILMKYGLEEYDDFELLKKSGGKLPIDTIEFIEPILLETLKENNELTRKLYVAGVRYHDYCNKNCVKNIELCVNEELLLIQEPNNEYDKNAIMIKTFDGKYKIGYIPAYFSNSLNEAMSDDYCVKCKVNAIKMIDCQECIEVLLSISIMN